MALYGIKSDGEWLTQEGRIITSRSPQILAETLAFGTLTRLRVTDRLHRSVDLSDAYRRSEPRTVIHRATVMEVGDGGVNELQGEVERTSRTIRELVEAPHGTEPLTVERPLGDATVQYRVTARETSSQ